MIRCVRRDTTDLEVLFLNENIGGHATVHLNIKQALERVGGLNADFLDIPRRATIRRLVGASLPVLGRLDADFQPVREQLATSVAGRRQLGKVTKSYDALHVYTQNCALVSTSILRAIPSVVTTDSANELNAYRLPYRTPTRFTRYALRPGRYLERRVLLAATTVIANTSWVADSLRGLGVPSSRLVVLPFGVQIPPPVARRDLDHPVITFIGHQLDRKGGRRLIELHQERFADKCDLVLVTTDPVAPRPGVVVRDDVRPGDGKLLDILAGTTAMVFPSLIDQAPNAVLEALAHGVPVVAYRQAGIAEMVRHGETGLLADVGDEAGLVAAIRAMIADPTRAATMGDAARRDVARRYNIEESVKSLADVLRHSRDLYWSGGPAALSPRGTS